MVICFSGDTADQAWQQAADVFRSGHALLDEASRSGPTHELLHVCFQVNDPRQRWVTSRQPALNPAFGLAEVVWIMAGRNDSSFINFWNPKLPIFAGDGDTYHGAYGHRLREHLGLDQLDRAYQALASNPSTRQVVLQIWDAAQDFPQENGTPSSKDIPCNVISLLKIREGQLHWTQIIRSNDLLLGVPHNFVQFMSLQEILAGWLGVDLGPYIQWSDSLHIYERDLKAIEMDVPEPSELNLDLLGLSIAESSHQLTVMVNQMELMTEPAVTAEAIEQSLGESGLHQSYKNVLLIIAADACRRLGDETVSRRLASQCVNPMLSQLWQRWQDRVQKKAS